MPGPASALTSPAGSGAAEDAPPSPGAAEPRKQAELGSGSRLLARRPFPLPFPLFTSPPASDAAGDDDEEAAAAALLLPDPITCQPAPPAPRLTDPRIGPDRTPLLGPRAHSQKAAPGCGWPRARRLGGRERGPRPL